jgi:3-methyladenine DNA glycosylase AlkD
MGGEMMRETNVNLGALQDRLEARANESTKTWWESYLKGAIPFRGVKMADIRAALHEWVREEDLDSLPAHEQRALALALIRLTYCEDKLAGVLYLQEILLPADHTTCADLPHFAALFADGHLYDWNTCDWFCVRVLGPLAEKEGENCARAISSWRDADGLWQRRAAGVAFVNLASRGEKNFPGFTQMLLDTCAATSRSPERFAQTGTGWVLRELSHAEPEQVASFVEQHITQLSAEAVSYATAKLPPATRQRLKSLKKGQR